MIAFFIDADNFSSPVWIDEAFISLEGCEGSVAIRRAYGSSESLKGLTDAMKLWAIKPILNLSLSKNTTDLCLAVDAMELACQTSGLKLVVIGSGDADFVPLVVRLREKGIRVFCISEKSKMAQDAIPAYDQVIYVGSSPVGQFDAIEAEKAVLTVKTSTDTPAKKVATKTTQTKAAGTTKPPPVKKVAAKKTAQTGEKITITQILDAVPKLKTGEWNQLREVAKPLHDGKLLGKSVPSTKLFKKYPNHFELRPVKQPSEVRFILPPQ